MPCHTILFGICCPWLAISGVISRVTVVIVMGKALKHLVVASPGPPSTALYYTVPWSCIPYYTTPYKYLPEPPQLPSHSPELPSVLAASVHNQKCLQTHALPLSEYQSYLPEICGILTQHKILCAVVNYLETQLNSSCNSVKTLWN